MKSPSILNHLLSTILFFQLFSTSISVSSFTLQVQASPPIPVTSKASLPSLLNDRALALRILVSPHEYSLDKSCPPTTSTNGNNRAFLKNLLTTTNRHITELDHIISSHLTQKKLDTRTSASLRSRLITSSLRLGACQLLYFDGVRDSVCVSETVNELRRYVIKGRSVVPREMVSFVNAVLRKIAFVHRPHNKAIETSDSSISLTQNITNMHPSLYARLVTDYGPAKASEISSSFKLEPLVYLTPLHPRIPLNSTWTRTSTGSIIVPRSTGSVVNIEGFKEGLFVVQDVSASLPALLLKSGLSRINKHSNSLSANVIDLCASPGGKTFQLLSYGYNITSVEISAPRVDYLMTNLARFNSNTCRGNVTVVQSNALLYNPDCAVVDGVLLDAPCSGNGTGRRYPERLRKDLNERLSLLPNDYNDNATLPLPSSASSFLLDLQTLQFELAKNAVAMCTSTSPTIFVYSTCSLLKSEGEDIMTRLINWSKTTHHIDLEVMKVEEGEVKGFEDAVDERGFIRVVPGVRNGDVEMCDGFFVARFLVKRKDDV